MTEQHEASRESSPDRRLVGWMVIAFAVAALALTARDALRGDTVRWTTWTLPALIVIDMGVLVFGWVDRWPRLVRPFYILSIVVAAAVLVSLALAHLHR